MKKRIELHAKTKYSMDHESTIDIKNLILKCVSNGEMGVAIVDTDGVTSLLKAEKILKELNIKDFKLIYGVELNVSFENKTHKVVTLIKNKKGVLELFRKLSWYSTNKVMVLEELMKNKSNLVLGLVYDEDTFDERLLQYFDYIEVDKNIGEDKLQELKKKIMVVYSNQINALEQEENLAKKVLYNKFNIEGVDNRIYETTEEVLNVVFDTEIVIDNPNKIFNMIEKFDILDDKCLLPLNNDFDIELLVSIKLSKMFESVPEDITKRVEEELKLIREYNYDGYINLYKKITDKCLDEDEEYVICDYINYLYIAYILGITHFDPIKMNLNYDIFFAHQPNISIKTSESFSKELLKYVIEDLGMNTIRCKGLMKINESILNKMFIKYEEDNNIKLSKKEKSTITKYLEDYPLSNHAITAKHLILPKDYNIFELSPRELIRDGNSYYRYTSMDYKDIEDKFITLEISSNDKITELKELKDMTYDKIINCEYNDELIINSDKFKNYLRSNDEYLVLDDLYEDLLNSDIDLPDAFNIINEIRNRGIISKNLKDILNKNNIKLKRYNNINFINKGIINEKSRLEYELLYFKEYYPLEYYYVLLKDCPFLEIIKIIEKGYDEVINKINSYPKDRYEYNYLNLVKEMYEENINFSIEDRLLVEYYCFELDQEEEKIVLVINKTNKEINKYYSYDLSLIGTRPANGKMEYMSKILHKLLDENKSVTLFGLNAPSNYYVKYLLNEITGIEKNAIHAYLNPCSSSNEEILSIDKDEYIFGLTYLLYHDLVIKDYNEINSTIIEGCTTLLDKLLYMIKNSNSSLIIIDDLSCMNEEKEKFLEKLKEIANTHNIKFIILTNLLREYETHHKKDLSSFDNSRLLDTFIDYIGILDKEDLYVVKENK